MRTFLDRLCLSSEWRLCKVNVSAMLSARPLYLRVSGHLNACVQELIKVLTELPGSLWQLSAGATGGVDHLPSRVVELSSRMIQITLGLLERLGAWRKLEGERERAEQYIIYPLLIPWGEFGLCIYPIRQSETRVNTGARGAGNLKFKSYWSGIELAILWLQVRGPQHVPMKRGSGEDRQLTEDTDERRGEGSRQGEIDKQ